MSNTQYRDFLVSIGYSEDEACNMIDLITKFEELEVYHV
jgi:hypothetical protein